MPRGYPKAIRYNPRALLSDMPTGPAGPRIMAERLGVERSLIYRWMNHESSLSFNQADQYAIRLGHHPSHYWPSWFDDALVDEKPPTETETDMTDRKQIYAVRLDADIVSKLDEEAKRLGISRGEIIRRYINRGLASNK